MTAADPLVSPVSRPRATRARAWSPSRTKRWHGSDRPLPPERLVEFDGDIEWQRQRGAGMRACCGVSDSMLALALVSALVFEEDGQGGVRSSGEEETSEVKVAGGKQGGKQGGEEGDNKTVPRFSLTYLSCQKYRIERAKGLRAGAAAWWRFGVVASRYHNTSIPQC
jgi:hypothetical protein